MLCTHRDYSKSWLAGLGIHDDDFLKHYCTSLYFVITTLTTCGFGEICATSGDKIEAFTITMLEFIGLIFYSFSIDKM